MRFTAFLVSTSSSVSYRTTVQITTGHRADYTCALQVSCPEGKVNRQWLSQSISLHSDISAARLLPGQLTAKHSRLMYS